MINDSTKDSLAFKNVGQGKYFPINAESSFDEIFS